MNAFVARLIYRIAFWERAKFLLDYGDKGVIPLGGEERKRLKDLGYPNPQDEEFLDRIEDRVPEGMPTTAQLSQPELFRERADILLVYADTVVLSGEEREPIERIAASPSPNDEEFLERIEDRFPEDMLKRNRSSMAHST